MLNLAITRLAFTPIDLTEEVIYEVPEDGTTLVTQMILCNTHTSAVTVNLSVTNSAASSTTTANRIFHSMSIDPGETMMIMADIYLYDGEKLWASASSDDVVNILISGVGATTAP
jgi:hypothetical protein